MISTVFFDVNGVVIISGSFTDRFAKKYNIPEPEVVKAFFGIRKKFRLPNAGQSFELWKPYLDAWGLTLSESDFFNFWFAEEVLNQPVVAVIEGLRQNGYRIALLSNNFSERTNYYNTTFPQLPKLADKTFYSWQTGFVKPDQKAFEHAVASMQCSPQECLFFDDSIQNITAAQRVGIHAYLYTGIASIRSAFEKHTINLYTI